MAKESKFIEELKKEYSEKLKKARQKEKDRLYKIYKEISVSLLKDIKSNQQFYDDLISLIEKHDCKYLRKSIEKLKEIYSVNENDNKDTQTAKKGEDE